MKPMTKMLNAELGREGAAGWSKSVYKGTNCGAWLEHVSDDCVRLGSIVEGSDACANPVTLNWPFTREQFWDALQGIEDQCEEIWNETHDENGVES